MLNSILDVAIGLVFVFLILSIMVSAMQEVLAGVFEHRGKMLKTGIEEMLSGSAILADSILSHPLVQSLQKGDRFPSYIPSATFSAALLDTLCQQQNLDRKVSPSILLDSLQDSNEKRILSLFIQECGNDWAALQTRIGQWYDDAMNRVSGWYKRNSQYWMFGIALIISIACNIDSLAIVKKLWSDETVRTYMVTQAEKLDPQATSGKEALAKLSDDMSKLEEMRNNQLPIGWLANNPNWFTPFGWLLTALAASLGAPFWFDALSQLLKLRGAGAKPQTPLGSTQSGAAPVQEQAKSATQPQPATSTLKPSPQNNPVFNKDESELVPHDIAAIQQALGMENSLCSGQLDQKTRDEIAKWQRANSANGTGVLTADQIKKLLYRTP